MVSGLNRGWNEGGRGRRKERPPASRAQDDPCAMGGSSLLEGGWHRCQPWEGPRNSPGMVSVPLQNLPPAQSMEAIRTAPPKSKKQKVLWLFSKREEMGQLCVSAGKARGLRGGPVENRETLGTAEGFRAEDLAFAPSRPTLGWAGRGWAGLCGVWGPCHLHPSPTEGLSFLPPALLRSLAQRPAGWGGGRPGRLCLGLECVLLQLKYSGSCQEPGH